MAERHRILLHSASLGLSDFPVLRHSDFLREELETITSALKGNGQRLIKIVGRQFDDTTRPNCYWAIVDAEPARHWFYDGDES